MCSSIFLVASLAGILLSTLLPLNQGIQARIYVDVNQTHVLPELICKTSCEKACDHSPVPVVGTPMCYSVNNVTSNLPCVGDKMCCEEINQYCYDYWNKNFYYCGSDCVETYFAPTCTITCGIHQIMRGIARPRYPWLLQGSPKHFEFKKDCGLQNSQCTIPRYSHSTRYYLPLPLFVLLIVSIVVFVVSSWFTIWIASQIF